MKTERGMKIGHRSIRLRALLAVSLPLYAAACGSDPTEETARLRGDRAFARGNYEEALAEYRLSLLREDPGTEGLVRAAHAYVVLGRVDEARALYDEAAREDSVHTDQAVSDFVALARREHESGDSYGAASAMEAALHFRPGILVEELALPLARHYSRAGEYGRAGAFFLRALQRNRDDPEVILETAEAHEEIGDCESALVYYGEFRELAPRREAEIRLNLGNCSFRLAGERRAQGADEEAIEYLDAVLELNEPRALIAQAHFEKAEIMAGMGDCLAALESYRAVADAGAAGPRALVRRARDRIDEIRFGRVEDGQC